MFDLSEEFVFLTGAAGQIGESGVNALLKQGARVVAVDLDMLALQKTAERNQWDRKGVFCIELDIRSEDAVEKAFGKILSQGGRITSLVNNAGVSVFSPWEDRTREEIDWVCDVNIKGSLSCTNAFLRHRLGAEGQASIVNIASVYGVVSPDPRIYLDCDRKNSEIYGATKAGLIQITKYFAVHAAKYNVRTNSISPGGIVSSESPQGPMFQRAYGERCPMGRMGEVSELAGALVFLISKEASYINGHNLVVDGGFTSW